MRNATWRPNFWEAGKFDEAIEHYENALSGIYEQDPDLLLGLATAQFGNDLHEKTRETLERLREHNPEYKSQDGHLLYARSLEASGDVEQTREEYSALVGYYAGAEARVRFGQFLEEQGDTEAAMQEYDEIMTVSDLAPGHYKKAQKSWINEAKAGIARLTPE